jgi:hypothetical protein
MEKSCLNCGVTFDRHPNAKFCSTECKDAKWQSNHWDKVLKTAERYRKSSKGQKNILSRHDTDIERFKKWKQENPNSDREWYERNKNTEKFKKRHNFLEANRRAAKLKAMPGWLTQEQKSQMRAIYNNCPEGFHVDHIVPLQGKEVRGLHVPWNLQVLPWKLNLKKSNKVA